jgi:hypothetical protein
MWEHLAALDVDSPVDDAVHCVAGRRDSLAGLEEVVAELREPFSDARRGPVLDVILQLVDLLVQGVDQVEEPLGDLVHEVVGDQSGFLDATALAGFADPAGVEGLTLGRRLADGQNESLGQDEVDLLVVDAILFRNRDRAEEDAEDIVAVALEGRPRIVLVGGRARQPVERAGVQVHRQLFPQLGRVWVDEIDPHALAHFGEATAVA